MENEKTEEVEYQMTEWLRKKGACGPTGYPHSYLNIQWCRAEVERLRGKGIQAYMRENEKGEIAEFRKEKR